MREIRIFIESDLQAGARTPVFYCHYIGPYQPLHLGDRLFDVLLGEYTVEQVELIRGTRKNTPKILLKLQEAYALRTIGSVLFTQWQEDLKIPPSESERSRLSGSAARIAVQPSKQATQ